MKKRSNKVYRGGASIDYNCRPKGSREISFDPSIMEHIAGSITHIDHDPDYSLRMCNVTRFVIKTALKYLPPKQRKIFYSVWCRSDGRLSMGIMDFSRRTGQSHFTNYNNYRKALNNIKVIMVKTGYEDYLISYLRGKL